MPRRAGEGRKCQGLLHSSALRKPRSRAGKAREGSWGGYEPEIPLALRLR